MTPQEVLLLRAAEVAERAAAGADPDIQMESTADSALKLLGGADDVPRPRESRLGSLGRRIQPQLALPLLGIAAWAYGVAQLRPSNVGAYGLLASGNAWFVIGLVLLVTGYVLELRRSRPRTWLLGLGLVGLIVAIHSAVPLIYGAPEYGWLYKHLGIIAAFQHYGHVTDPSNIYQQWPALFAAVAAVASLAHVNAVSFAGWAPLAFELADALLLLALFRLLTSNRRIVVARIAALRRAGRAGWGRITSPRRRSDTCCGSR